MTILQPYSEYKNSGVEWLADVPSGWKLKRLKFAVRRICNKENRNANSPYVGLENIMPSTGSLLPVEDVDEEETSLSSTFEIGDVLFGKLRPYLAKAWIATFSGFCSSEFLVLRKHELEPRFLLYSVLNPQFVDMVNSSTFGSKMPRADWNFIGNLNQCLPSENQQTAIANFLDRETARIDALIEKKERQIALLEEKRQATITQAITKGLNPDAPMKDSGIEWLGYVPEHWEVVPLRYGMRFVNGMAFKPTEWREAGTPIIRIQNLNEGENFNFFDGEFPSKYLVESGDLLFGWSGNRGTSFGPFQWSREGRYVLNQHIFKLVDISYSRRWLYFALKAVTKTIEDQAHGIIGMVHITKDKLGAIRIPVPPSIDQTSIANFLDCETSHIDTLAHKINSSISLLRERRAALITAAVTGHIDVRESA